MKDTAHNPSPISTAMTVWLWITVIFLLYRTVVYLLYAAGHIMYPYDYDAGEGLILSRAWILAHGGNVYGPISQEPYFVMNYPPVFEGLVALMMKLCGPGLWIGRLLSVASAGGTAYFLYRCARNLSGLVLPSAVAGLMYFASCWLTSWSVIGRIDTFGVMCAVAGLTVMTRPGDGSGRRKAVGAAVLFSLALFTRQSLIAAPLACVLASLGGGPRRGDGGQRLTFLAAMVLIPLAAVTLLMVATHGEFFRHTVIYTMGEYDIAEFGRWMGEYLNLHGVVTALVLIFSIVGWRKEPLRLPILFWGLSLAVSLTAGKEGSSINYFLEFWAASCLLTGLMLGELARDTGGTWSRVAGPAVVGVLLIQILVLHYRTDFNAVRDTYRQSSRMLTRYIQQTPGEVLSEYTGYLVTNGKTPVYQPFSMTQLAERGIWDEGPLIEDIKRQRFGLIIMTNVGKAYGRWSAAMQAAVDARYDLIDTQPCYELSYYHSAVNLNFVYRPKSAVEGP